MANNTHPTAVIGPDVHMGDQNTIGPYSVIAGHTTIGSGNWIGPHVVIGTPPEIYGVKHGPVWESSDEIGEIIIGDRNVIHEFANIQPGSVHPTRIGDDCFLMTQTHVGHDCILGDRVILSCSVMLGGLSRVWSGANVGMSSVVHQRLQVGPGAMVGMGSAVRRNAPAFAITLGNPARTTGINTVGLERNGVPPELVDAMTEYLLGRGEMPEGVPADLAERLRAWQQETHSE
ncbi:UDP-N-acetylglucosamine acyltransferase [Blastococcus sp. Marseille-P5729]|uniref:UDP-N-acetylglucosamine acyltransferase n=1 Tax=Blastococcus sp. Marseille-P5729 TaxID=2086582 RepID=UPI000D0E5D8E|nr:UDP-N-acetylglucosamine acyltransferase [Blastococcus sp. Marseille-P5729]